MSLIAISSLESAREKFFKNSTSQEAKISLTANTSLQSASSKFFMNSTYLMSRK